MTIHQHRTWTEDRANHAAKLWLDGLGATAIAEILGNTSRNAIIGKMHRMGLGGAGRTGVPDAQKPNPKPRKPRAKKTYPSRPKAPEVPIPQSTKRELVFEPPIYAPSDRMTVMDLVPRACRWPIGDPGSEGFSFCGRRSETGIPYCPAHMRIAYQPAVRRRRRAGVTVIEVTG